MKRALFLGACLVVVWCRAADNENPSPSQQGPQKTNWNRVYRQPLSNSSEFTPGTPTTPSHLQRPIVPCSVSDSSRVAAGGLMFFGQLEEAGEADVENGTSVTVTKKGKFWWRQALVLPAAVIAGGTLAFLWYSLLKQANENSGN